MIDQMLYGCIALIALTNPLAELPFFFAATDGFSRAELRRAAVKVAFGVLIVLSVSAVAGARILGLFDVSFAAFRAAGGLVIILAALEMLRGAGFGITGVRRAPGETEDHLWVPLVMPLIAGPAAITAVITLALEEPGVLIVVPVATLIAVFVAAVGVLAVLLAASFLSNALSRRAVRIFERFSGLILLAIGCQMALGGIQEFFMRAPQ
ncbi:MarC family protein [Candidatus Palauibacter sp.]|uniref:MarC family protein n=1 Tax=Candidatus Palauibacter sp. TaxID=3101350 RepID=UPI003B58EF29